MTEPDAAPPMCLECGADNAETAQVCARCGAPLAHQLPAAAGTAGDSRGSIPLPDELAGRRDRPGARRTALIVAGAGLVLLVAVTVLVASVTMIITRLVSSRPSASSARPAASSSPTASASQVTRDQLRPGDCLQVPRIDTISELPHLITAVPCTQSHTGEVFFADHVWPRSMAYPGDGAIDNQAKARCDAAFTAYDGFSPDISNFTYMKETPTRASWSNGDRSLQCIAYYNPGGLPTEYSIKGSYN